MSTAEASLLSRPGRRRLLRVAIGVFLFTFVLYLPALGNGFVNWDDDLYVTDNPAIRELGPALMRYAFLEIHVVNWHPLTWLSHALDFAAWGPEAMGHHLTSVLLHAANAALVVVLAALIFRRIPAPAGSSTWAGEGRVLAASCAVGLLFGIHPIHVESAAWVSERKDVLSALFYLGSLIVWFRVAGAPRQAGERVPGRSLAMVASITLFILALLAKPMAVSLPVVMLVLDWYPLRRLRDPEGRRTALAELLPFALLAGGVGVIAVLAQKGGGAVVTLEDADLGTRVLVAARAVVMYLGKLVFPVDLLPFYPHPRVASWTSARYLLPVTAVVAATTACLAIARRQAWWLAAWVAYLAMLAPVLGIVQAGGQSMADRYLYLPSIPPLLLAGAGIAHVLVGAKGAFRAVALAVCAGALMLLSVATVRQIGIWKSSLTLWTYVIEREPRSVPHAYYNRGQVHLDAGDLPRAIADYTAALALNPLYRQAVYNRGLAYQTAGDLGRAAADFREAIRLDPRDPLAFNNLGVVLARSGSFAEAVEAFTRALGLDPVFGAAMLNRGLALSSLGQEGAALGDLRGACRLGTGEACSILLRVGEATPR